LDAVDGLIAEYRAAVLDEHGECHRKSEIIAALEGHLADERTLAFFLEVIGDLNEYDLARIDALKILELWQASDTEASNRVGLVVANVLVSEEDVLVQQWAAIAAGSLMTVPEVFAAVSGLLADQAADLDVRHNCLAAVQQMGNTDECIRLLRSIDDRDLKPAVNRILNEWSVPSKRR
jgi:hypothetical protein